jgi:hypothetical protein
MASTSVALARSAREDAVPSPQTLQLAAWRAREFPESAIHGHEPVLCVGTEQSVGVR